MLVTLPPSGKDRTKVMLGFLEAAKAQLDLTADVLCPKGDRQGFEALVSPRGHFFFVPHLLRPAEWESDPAEVAATEKRLHEAELAAGLPVGRVVMGAAHTAGRAFTAPVRKVRRYPLVRRVLKDNSEPFRIVRRLFRFADEVLRESDPDFVCAHEYATVLNASLWLAAKRRGIPCLSIRYSKISSDRAFWTLDRLMLNTAATSRGAAKRESDAAASSIAEETIRKFRDRPATVNYIASKWRSRARRGFFAWHLQNARIVGRELVNRSKGADQSLVEPPLGRLARYYQSRILGLSQPRFLHRFDEAELAKTKYVYFPMHKEAELALALQATQWYDQRNTIHVLASALPFGYRLLVRENILNYGNCPTRIYRELLRIPNVVLVDPLESQFKYLRHADLVVTENGSSGWEGLILGRRVLLLSKTFYDGAGQGVKLEKPEQLSAAILDTLSRPAVTDHAAFDRGLSCMIDADLDTTFRMSDEGVPAALDLLKATIGPALRSQRASRTCAA